nr:phosphate acetyltransferase [Gammaproteobacteria bacterium]
MSFERLLEQAADDPATIVLPEGDDPRVIRAARRAVDHHIARPVLLGDYDAISQVAAQEKIDLTDLQLVNPETHDERAALQSQLHSLREHRGMTEELAATTILDRLHYGCMLVKSGLVEGCVAGAVYPTADVVRTAMQLIGKHPDYGFVSSFFIMLLQQEFHPVQGAMIFADCALVVNPDENQ